MNKAILVLDEMPKSCVACFASNIYAGTINCDVMIKAISKDTVFKSRPSWCPIRKAPDISDLKESCENLCKALGGNND